DVVTKVRGDALQPAYRDRLAIDARAAARGLAGAVARAPENAGKDVRLPIHEVRLRVPALSDQPNVFGDVRVGGTRPLAIDNLMVIARVADVRRSHDMWMIASGCRPGKYSVLGRAARGCGSRRRVALDERLAN